jgi:hypothetical protein
VDNAHETVADCSQDIPDLFWRLETVIEMWEKESKEEAGKLTQETIAPIFASCGG